MFLRVLLRGAVLDCLYAITLLYVYACVYASVLIRLCVLFELCFMLMFVCLSFALFHKHVCMYASALFCMYASALSCVYVDMYTVYLSFVFCLCLYVSLLFCFVYMSVCMFLLCFV